MQDLQIENEALAEIVGQYAIETANLRVEIRKLEKRLSLMIQAQNQEEKNAKHE